MRPRRYSAVMNMRREDDHHDQSDHEPEQESAARGVAAKSPSPTPGAMSPDPVRTNAASERW